MNILRQCLYLKNQNLWLCGCNFKRKLHLYIFSVLRLLKGKRKRLRYCLHNFKITNMVNNLPMSSVIIRPCPTTPFSSGKLKNPSFLLWYDLALQYYSNWFMMLRCLLFDQKKDHHFNRLWHAYYSLFIFVIKCDLR